jgi:hypothetical protein
MAHAISIAHLALRLAMSESAQDDFGAVADIDGAEQYRFMVIPSEMLRV